ncbi:MAG TPA: phosphoribosylglycinamide formyltransferase [Rectinemataceae bacterium]|nr:phosphoribosylglycinamide formyltransferase [Rectinemataceae bacterium]
MASFAVLASGTGSNFEALCRALEVRHRCVLLVHDRRAAPVAGKAAALGVPSIHVSYVGRSPVETEAELMRALSESGAELVLLAGFMRLLSPAFVTWRPGKIVNVHPSLLPAWPGLGALARSFAAGERRFGVTIHLVDAGMDTGPILAQQGFDAERGQSLEEIERRVHEIEHTLYPAVAGRLLDGLDAERGIS